MLTDTNFWFSVITACVAIIAIIQTQVQIRLSNKQHLFDKRVESYLIAIGLLQLYENNYSTFDREDEPFLAIDVQFSFFTNNTYLEQIASSISSPIGSSEHKQFLIKMENLTETATKIKFLFSGSASVLLGDFVLRYQELLFSMYQYHILIVKMQAENEKSAITLEEAGRRLGEKQQRINLKKAFDNLKQTYICLEKENVKEKIEKQIKL